MYETEKEATEEEGDWFPDEGIARHDGVSLALLVVTPDRATSTPSMHGGDQRVHMVAFASRVGRIPLFPSASVSRLGEEYVWHLDHRGAVRRRLDLLPRAVRSFSSDRER